MAERRLLAVAAGNDMRAIADGERDFGHQPRSSRAITSSSAWTASAIRARNAACRLASVSFWRVRAVTARSIRAIARTMRSEEHTSELQSLMRISYAVFCLKKKKSLQQKKDTHAELITYQTYTYNT